MSNKKPKGMVALTQCSFVLACHASWKGPGLRQQFSPMGTLVDCADMVISSETVQTPVYLKIMSAIDMNQSS